MKINDTVRILAIPEDDPNGFARIVDILPNGKVVVSNMNMPFCGTYANLQLFPYEVLVDKTWSN